MKISNFFSGAFYGFLAAATAVWVDLSMAAVVVITIVCAIAGFVYGDRVVRFIKEYWGWT